MTLREDTGLESLQMRIDCFLKAEKLCVVMEREVLGTRKCRNCQCEGCRTGFGRMMKKSRNNTTALICPSIY